MKRDPLPADRDAITEAVDNMLRRQHHSANCPGCDLCMTGDCKIDRNYPDAQDLDVAGRPLRAGT